MVTKQKKRKMFYAVYLFIRFFFFFWNEREDPERSQLVKQRVDKIQKYIYVYVSDVLL